MKMSLTNRNADSLTEHDLVDFYVQAFQILHDENPECVYLSGNRFQVDGIEHDRRWLMLEIELLHQQLIIKASEIQNPSQIFKLVRRFQRIFP